MLANVVQDAGIIGAGGAGFPTHVKVGTPVENIIVNGAECEPLMSGDQWLMENRAGEMLAGVSAVACEFEAKLKKRPRVVIGVKKKYKKAIEVIGAAVNESGVEILELPNIYPSGDEQFLVYEATGKIVPEGGIPPMVNSLVMNVGTLVQLNDALGGVPVTERTVTLGGAVANPCVTSLPIGTSFAEIIPQLGPLVDDYVILVNGPMMGRITEDLTEVTTKTMGGLFILPRRHSHVRRMRRPIATEIKLSKSVCEVCRYCTDFCPRFLQGHSLEPHKIMRVINYDRDLDTKTITSAQLCCECGACDLWACPMSLSPRVIFREFKKKLNEAGIKNPHTNIEPKTDPQRKFRGIPTDRLTARLGLTEYDIRPPFRDNPWDVTSVKILLNQHVGAPSIPTVKAGERVTKNQQIAKIPDKKLGAVYHASITGAVTKTDSNSITIEKQ